MTIRICTSIPPFFAGSALDPARTWQQHDFSVVSVASVAEATCESPEFPVIQAQRDAFALTGKHLVYLDDVLSVATEDNNDECGIVNADIFLAGGPLFAAFVAEQALGALIFGSRIDIARSDTKEGDEYTFGFDFFFFDREIAKLFPATDLCLGAPWWDYWMPLVPLLHGYPVKLLVTPVAYHQWHETKWNPELFDLYGRKVITYLQAPHMYKLLPTELQKAVDQAQLAPELTEFAQTVCHYIRKAADHIFYPETPSLADMAILSRGQYNVLRQYEAEIIRLQNLAKEFAGNTLQVTVELEKCRARLNALEASNSWRLTKPLRRMMDKLRQG